MVAGQMADLEAEGRDDPTIEALEAIHVRKTGALLRAALKMGGIVAGADPARLQALTSYGHAVGLAFQIVDDLLDVTGDEAKMGKRVNKDSGLGKWTYPGLLGRRRQPEAGRGPWPRRPSAALEPFGDGARRSAPWRWIYWKGTADESRPAGRHPLAAPT